MSREKIDEPLAGDKTTEMNTIVCLECPKGCVMEVTLPEGADPSNTESIEVSGNECKLGVSFASNELIDPRRTLTTTVRVKGITRMLPVRSSEPVPKNRIHELMIFLDSVTVDPPVVVNQIISKNVLGLGIDIIATWPVQNQK